MTSKKKVLIGIVAVTGFVMITLFVVGREMAKRFAPYIREQAIDYLQHRFDSKVEIGALRISVPNLSPYRLLLSKGRGAIARVEGENILLEALASKTDRPIFLQRRGRNTAAYPGEWHFQGTEIRTRQKTKG